MSRYRFYRKDFCIYKDWIIIIPTIVLHFNNPIYTMRTIELQYGWLCFHGRFMWEEVKQ